MRSPLNAARIAAGTEDDCSKPCSSPPSVAVIEGTSTERHKKKKMASARRPRTQVGPDYLFAYAFNGVARGISSFLGLYILLLICLKFLAMLVSLPTAEIAMSR